jgi:uncharacterized lipoprotein YddW (UPF0748 family)
MRLSLIALTVSATLAAGPGQAGASELHRTFWIDPTRTDLTDPATRAQLLQQPVQRLVVTVLTAGQTPFPNPPGPFAPLPRYRDKPDVLADLLQEAQERGRAVWFAFDCLHWADPETPSDRDILARKPELAELDQDGTFGRREDGKYASPFHPGVRQALAALIQEVAVRYPTLKGIVLQARLPTGSMLSYSKAARSSYKAARKQDLPEWPLPSGPEGAQKAAPWLAWRTAECTALVRELSTAYRAKVPKGKVAATGSAGWYRAPLAERLLDPGDWLNWVAVGAVEEIFLEAEWGSSQSKSAYRAARDLVGRIRKPVRLSAVLSEVEGPAAEAALRALLTQDATGIVVRPGLAADPETAKPLLTETLPQVQSRPLDLDPTDLKGDPRLQTRLTLQLHRPAVEEVLQALREATGVTLSADEHLDRSVRAFDSLALKNDPAWHIMLLLAQADAVRGRWIRDGADYRLLGSVTSAVVAEPTRSTWRYWLAGISGVLAGVTAFLSIRRRRSGDLHPARNETATAGK